MSYSNWEVAHRWVHNQLGRNGELNGSSMSANERSMYSYRTVIAQCLDRDKNVFLVIDETLSSTTGKHVLHVLQAIPDYATKIRTHWRSGYYGWDNVSFMSSSEKFDRKKRLELVTHLLGKTLGNYESVKTARNKNADVVAKTELADIDALYDIYGDCSLDDWLRRVNQKSSGLKMDRFRKMRLMVRLYLDKKSDAEITDALLGKGTWDEMLKRIAPLKKAEDTRRKMAAFVEHLGYRPIHGYWHDNRPECPFNSWQLRKLSVHEINEIRFRNFMIKERNEQIEKKYGNLPWGEPKNDKAASYKRALKFLGITYGRFDGAESVVKTDGTLVFDRRPWPMFDVDCGYIHYADDAYWNKTDVYFDITGNGYKSFCLSPDKFVWRERFWKICELKMRRLRGSYLYYKREACEEKGIPFDMNEEDNHIYNEFVARKNRQYDFEERQRKAIEAKRAAQRKAELEKIAAYREQGIDGVRRLWIERLESIPQEILYSPELCYGGNILLRFSMQEGIVETSKGIRLTFKECFTYYETIKRWHDNGSFENGVLMKGYMVQSFKNDILTAGCHRIAWCEIERMYNELVQKESKMRVVA